MDSHGKAPPADWFIRLTSYADESSTSTDKFFSLSQLYSTAAILNKDGKAIKPTGLVNGGMILGRKSSAAKVLRRGEFASPIMSRSHAQFTITPSGHVYLTDLNSLHGTALCTASTDMAVAAPIRLEPYAPVQVCQNDALILGKNVHAGAKDYPPIRLHVTFRYPELGAGSAPGGERKYIPAQTPETAAGKFAGQMDALAIEKAVKYTASWAEENAREKERGKAVEVIDVDSYSDDGSDIEDSSRHDSPKPSKYGIPDWMRYTSEEPQPDAPRSRSVTRPSRRDSIAILSDSEQDDDAESDVDITHGRIDSDSLPPLYTSSPLPSGRRARASVLNSSEDEDWPRGSSEEYPLGHRKGDEDSFTDYEEDEDDDQEGPEVLGVRENSAAKSDAGPRSYSPPKSWNWHSDSDAGEADSFSEAGGEAQQPYSPALAASPAKSPEAAAPVEVEATPELEAEAPGSDSDGLGVWYSYQEDLDVEVEAEGDAGRAPAAASHDDEEEEEEHDELYNGMDNEDEPAHAPAPAPIQLPPFQPAPWMGQLNNLWDLPLGASASSIAAASASASTAAAAPALPLLAPVPEAPALPVTISASRVTDLIRTLNERKHAERMASNGMMSPAESAAGDAGGSDGNDGSVHPAEEQDQEEVTAAEPVGAAPPELEYESFPIEMLPEDEEEEDEDYIEGDEDDEEEDEDYIEGDEDYIEGDEDEEEEEDRSRSGSYVSEESEEAASEREDEPMECECGIHQHSLRELEAIGETLFRREQYLAANAEAGVVENKDDERIEEEEEMEEDEEEMNDGEEEEEDGEEEEEDDESDPYDLTKELRNRLQNARLHLQAARGHGEIVEKRLENEIARYETALAALDEASSIGNQQEVPSVKTMEVDVEVQAQETAVVQNTTVAEYQAPELMLAANAQAPVTQRERTPSISDQSSAGPVTPPTIGQKRSLPIEFVDPSVDDSPSVPAGALPITVDASTSTGTAASADEPPAKRQRVEEQPKKRGTASAFGLVVLGAALGSIGTIAGLMQLGE
ncbi:hypothetical protein IAT38_004236 [Cryptococcus sp. DSM 104549]